VPDRPTDRRPLLARPCGFRAHQRLSEPKARDDLVCDRSPFPAFSPSRPRPRPRRSLLCRSRLRLCPRRCLLPSTRRLLHRRPSALVTTTSTYRPNSPIEAPFSSHGHAKKYVVEPHHGYIQLIIRSQLLDLVTPIDLNAFAFASKLALAALLRRTPGSQALSDSRLYHFGHTIAPEA
jgi:hypothetical protein